MTASGAKRTSGTLAASLVPGRMRSLVAIGGVARAK